MNMENEFDKMLEDLKSFNTERNRVVEVNKSEMEPMYEKYGIEDHPDADLFEIHGQPAWRNPDGSLKKGIKLS